MTIPIFRPTAGDAEAEAVRRVFASGWLGKGPQVSELEREFERRYGGHAVSTNSCTAALSLAYRAFGVHDGDDVIVPTWTFCSTAHAAARLGARVRFADVSSVLCSTAKHYKPLLNRHTRAVAWVGMAGEWLYSSSVALWAKAAEVPLIIDAAHMPDVESWDDYGPAAICFSFHAVKPLGAGDGGMVIFKDERKAEWARRYSWLGIDKSTHERSSESYTSSYDICELGQKCHMNDITAAIVRTQLARFDDDRAKKRRIAAAYRDGLDASIETPNIDDQHGCHLYIVKLPDTPGRNVVKRRLALAGITTGIHYRPLHTFGAYDNHDACPTAERLYGRVLSLPFYPQMTAGEQAYVIAHINEATTAKG